MTPLIPTITPLYNAGFGVIGQPNFTSSATATTQNGINAPTGLSLDSSGNLYVADTYNNRVLMFEPPFSNDMNASVVIGQPNFTSSAAAITQNGFYAPTGLSLDSSGNLYVADTDDNRVLIFEPPFSNGMNASVVIGQPNFTSSALATTQNGFYGPYRVSLDSSGNLYVADTDNYRVLMFKPPFSNGMNAGDTNQSVYSIVVYPNNRGNIFYNPHAGLVKL